MCGGRALLWGAAGRRPMYAVARRRMVMRIKAILAAAVCGFIYSTSALCQPATPGGPPASSGNPPVGVAALPATPKRDQATAASRVIAVTVYQGNALVTREVDVPAGQG